MLAQTGHQHKADSQMRSFGAQSYDRAAPTSRGAATRRSIRRGGPAALALHGASFYQESQRRGFRLIDVPDSEFLTMGPNVLALAPGQCLMLENNPLTKRRLEAAGCEVLTDRDDEISLKAEGGPTCLTRPILRG